MRSALVSGRLALIPASSRVRTWPCRKNGQITCRWHRWRTFQTSLRKATGSAGGVAGLDVRLDRVVVLPHRNARLFARTGDAPACTKGRKLTALDVVLGDALSSLSLLSVTLGSTPRVEPFRSHSRVIRGDFRLHSYNS